MDKAFFKRVKALFWVLLIDLFVFPGLVQAGDHAPVGARSAGMGHASVTLPDSYSLWNNPSGLACSPHVAVLWSVHVPFGISDLSLKSLGVIFPVGQTVIASNLSYFGYSSYHEWEMNLVLAKKLSLTGLLGFRWDFLRNSWLRPISLLWYWWALWALWVK